MKLKKQVSFLLAVSLVLGVLFGNVGKISASAASIKKSGEVSTIKEYGIDVSKHNGTIDWEKVKKSGVDFAIIRAGYSHTVDSEVDITLDNKFYENYAGAKAAGIKVGVYVYSYATEVKHAEEDAEALIEVIKGKTFEYPIFYDMEDKTQLNLSSLERTKIASAFIDKMKAEGYYAGVYANENWYKNKLIYETLLEKGAIWFAKWRDNKKADVNYCEYGIWQYTSSGNISGIDGRVDCNVSFIDYSKIIKKSGLNGFGPSGNSMYVSPIYYADYNGKPVTPDTVVQVGTVTLRKNIDYKVTFYNNNRAGLAVAVYNGINDFAGYYARQMFTVRRRSLAVVTVKKIGSREYTGTAITPNLNLYDYQNKLVKNTDYKLSYKNSTKLGTATVTVTGINYKGTETVTFKIVPRQLKNCTVSGIENLEYNGKTRKFSNLKVKVGDNTVSASNYTVKYKNNKNIGTATVTVTAKSGNFTGSITKSFKINPKSVTKFKLSKKAKSTAVLKWNKVSNCDGYIVYKKASNGKYKAVKTVKGKSNCTFTDKNFKNKTSYYKIKAYKTIGKKQYTGNTVSLTVKK